jgi:hypothetical protein
MRLDVGLPVVLAVPLAPLAEMLVLIHFGGSSCVVVGKL